MKATSHFAMAHLLFASLQKRGIYLNRIAFVYGNIEPDQTPAMWFHPHFCKVCSKTTALIVEELANTPVNISGQIGAYYSKRLGMLCHFLCDYFCFAHNEEFSGNLKQHVAYENELDVFLRRNCLDVLDIDAKDELPVCLNETQLLNEIESSRSEYLKTGFSFQNDLAFAFGICMAAMVNTIAISKQLPAPTLSIELEEFISSLKGYATGRNLIFRMFMFKYRNHDLFFLPNLMPPIGAYS